MFSESLGMQQFQFFLQNIFQVRLSISTAQDPASALRANYRAFSTSYTCFRGQWPLRDGPPEAHAAPHIPFILYPFSALISDGA